MQLAVPGWCGHNGSDADTCRQAVFVENVLGNGYGVNDE